MPYLFIRHNLRDRAGNFCSPIIQHLYKQRKVAVSYAGCQQNGDPLDYKNYSDKSNAKSQIKKFLQYASEGAIVFADFDQRLTENEVPSEGFGIIAGKIKPGTPVHVEHFEEILDANRRDKVDFLPLKTIQLEETRLFKYSDFPLLLSAKPAGPVTFCNWNVIRRQLEGIWERRELRLEAENLSDQQLEIACFEYLRLEGVLDCLQERIGKAMPDADIIGLNHKREVMLTQVTHETNPEKIEDKITRLRRHSRDARCIFCAYAAVKKQIEHEPDIEFIALEKIINRLIQDESSVQHEMVKRMINPWQFAKN